MASRLARRAISTLARASDAYAPASSPTPSTSTSPSLNHTQREQLSTAIRIDQAGELAANWIYAGQMSVLQKNSNDERLKALVQDMWDQEKRHLRVFDDISRQHVVEPTALTPLVKGIAYGLGVMTASMGKEAAMACTEAVETVIGEHYNDQLRDLDEKRFPNDHPSIPLLKNIIQEFRDDELEHLDTAVLNDAQKAPGHALLSAFIAAGCNLAIKAVERM